MHYWRAPVPAVWIDFLQKIKAAGYSQKWMHFLMADADRSSFNTVSFYGNWGESSSLSSMRTPLSDSQLGYHSAKDGVLGFESGAHNFTKLFDIAKQVGLYIYFRPGPYVNAEATAGGFPGWVSF